MNKHGMTFILVVVMASYLIPVAASGEEPLPISVFAEDPWTDIKPGTLVRVHTRSGPNRSGDKQNTETYVGKFKSCIGGELVVRPEDPGAQEIRVPVDQVDTLEVGSSNKGSSSLLGAFIGLGVGIVVGATSQSGPSDCEGFLCEMDEMENRVALGTGIALGCAMVGAVIGAATGKEKWTTVDRMPVGLSLQGGGNGSYQVAIGVAF